MRALGWVKGRAPFFVLFFCLNGAPSPALISEILAGRDKNSLSLSHHDPSFPFTHATLQKAVYTLRRERAGPVMEETVLLCSWRLGSVESTNQLITARRTGGCASPPFLAQLKPPNSRIGRVQVGNRNRKKGAQRKPVDEKQSDKHRDRVSLSEQHRASEREIKARKGRRRPITGKRHGGRRRKKAAGSKATPWLSGFSTSCQASFGSALYSLPCAERQSSSILFSPF
jgi:hypothetical protein